MTGIVLAGGKSSRMGTDKAALRVGPYSLVERCLATLRQCFAQNIIIGGRLNAGGASAPRSGPARGTEAAPTLTELGVPVFPDEKPGLGPIGGLLTALRRVDTPVLFLVACDMPFLDARLIRQMACELAGYDAVAIPGEPLHAVYATRILPVVEQQIASGDCAMKRLLAQLRVKEISDVGWQQSLTNINTPRELEAAKRHGE